MNKQIKDILVQLYQKHFKKEVLNIDELPSSGSYRQYFRIHSNDTTCIGAYNSDVKENKAFIGFTRHFSSLNIPVPEIIAVSDDEKYYLLNDLGDTTLFSFLQSHRKTHGFSEDLLNLYKKVLDYMPAFQIEGAKGLDFSLCYPRAVFDKQSMMWDLNYFKYYFLKLARISFDEQLLENDFEEFTKFLLQSDTNYFLYRDFQSRNIMLHDNNIVFIDYQGGRKGALQYDLASLLYDAKADIPEAIRKDLLEYYISNLQRHISFNKTEFSSHYYGFVLIRIMQALGAYGFRGYYENKTHFLQSIPYALQNLQHLLDHNLLPDNIPYLKNMLEKLKDSEKLQQISDVKPKLHLTISSFSYKKGIPADVSGNGGGFVFDCRALPNPGRLEEYKKLCGKDPEVVQYLEAYPEVNTFIRNTFQLIEQSVNAYIERGFTHLMVSFGCTGGQHRSVYSAEKAFAMLKDKQGLDITITHIEEPNYEAARRAI